jgi:hypothetical protein
MDPLFPPRPLPGWQSFFARPLAAAMVLIGWLLRVVGVAPGAAVLVVGIYMSGFDDDFGGRWYWAVVLAPAWAFAATVGGFQLFYLGHLLVEWGDELQRRCLPPTR